MRYASVDECTSLATASTGRPMEKPRATAKTVFQMTCLRHVSGKSSYRSITYNRAERGLVGAEARAEDVVAFLGRYVYHCADGAGRKK